MSPGGNHGDGTPWGFRPSVDPTLGVPSAIGPCQGRPPPPEGWSVKVQMPTGCVLACPPPGFGVQCAVFGPPGGGQTLHTAGPSGSGGIVIQPPPPIVPTSPGSPPVSLTPPPISSGGGVSSTGGAMPNVTINGVPVICCPCPQKAP